MCSYLHTLFTCVRIIWQHFYIYFKVCLFVLMLPALPTADVDNTVDSITFAWAMLPIYLPLTYIRTSTLNTSSSSVHCKYLEHVLLPQEQVFLESQSLHYSWHCTGPLSQSVTHAYVHMYTSFLVAAPVVWQALLFTAVLICRSVPQAVLLVGYLWLHSCGQCTDESMDWVLICWCWCWG